MSVTRASMSRGFMPIRSRARVCAAARLIACVSPVIWEIGVVSPQPPIPPLVRMRMNR